jgi:hypothetical protein
MFRAPKVVVPAWVVYGLIAWPRWVSLIIYSRIRDLWGSTNFVALRVAKSNDTLPYLQGVHRVGHPQMPIEVSRERRVVGCTRGVFVTHVCCVVRWLPFQGCKLVAIFTTLSEMSDTCLLQSFSSNVTFIMLIMIMRMALTTLLVNGLIILNIEWLPLHV